MTQQSSIKPEDPLPSEKPFSLSRYFPEGTEYFYGYPAEEDSHFFNGVQPEIEELVAARPLVCAGPGVKTICFKATTEDFVWGLMEDLGVLNVDKKNIITLPKLANRKVKGGERNKMLKQALVDISHPGKLVMAQPYLDTRLKTKYAIPSHRIVWLNDKHNMNAFIPWQYITKTYDEFLDGECFEDSADQIALPCVIKVSSSSAGDGVRICFTEDDIEKAKEDFSHLEGMIIVTELVDVKRNFGVQFGIPADEDKPMEIIQWHEQLTDKNGSFVGGIIEPNQNNSIFKPLSRLILQDILPEVRRKGWFGIGGFDVLMSKDERFYFVDPNFRMTGMSVYDLLAQNKEIKKPLLSFSGTYSGSQTDFKNLMAKIARVGSTEQKLFLTALTEHDGVFRFNSALLFDDRADIPKLSRELIGSGIQSQVLDRFLP